MEGGTKMQSYILWSASPVLHSASSESVRLTQSAEHASRLRQFEPR